MDQVGIELNGEIDVDVSEALRARVLDAVRRAAGEPVVVDMSQVTFIDSSGLSALLAGLRLARNHGGTLSLVGVSPSVRRIFDVTGLGEQFGLE
jgi:anti-sigma B factor antagonist